MEHHKKLSSKKFDKYMDILAKRLKTFTNKNNLRIDYICPILRSGAIPAVYLANKLNIIKFAPIQIKHIEYKNGESGYVTLFTPFEGISVQKKEPVFLLVDATRASGESAKTCIKEIKAKYPDAKVLFVCITKEYNSQSLKDELVYEDVCFYYNGSNEFTKKKCKELGIDYYIPLYPWEILEQEQNHPDDFEENIFY